MKIGVFTIMVAFLLAAGFPLVGMAGPAPDADNDTVADSVDNCVLVPNGATGNNQCDSDQDGYGNSCDADTTNDFIVGIPDFGTFTATFNNTGSPDAGRADTNCDGIVGIPDFGTFTARFNGTPGPSGKPCAGTIPCN